MFCPKCGNQLPDGAAFCASCGSPLNAQPVAPVEATAPTQPVVPEMVDIPGEPVMNDMTMQSPMGGQFMPQSQAPITNQMSTMAKPKKSKAPLFIILGVSVLLIAIIAIVLILVFSDDDNNDKPASGNEAQSTTSEQESSTEEETTTDSSNNGGDYSDAEDLVKDFMSDLESEEYANAAKYIYPAFKEYLISGEFGGEDIGMTEENIAGLFTMPFVDPSYSFLDYSVEKVYEDNEDTFKDEYKNDLETADSYVEPEAFARAELEVSYNDQTSTIYLLLAYCEDQFYIYGIDDSGFDIEFEEETSTESESGNGESINISESLTTNIQTISGDVTGVRNSYDGYSIVVPDTWTIDTSSSVLYFTSSDQITNINVVSDSAFALLGAESYFETLLDSFESMGLENVEIGTLYANDLTGYYTKYDYPVTDTMTYYGMQFIYVKDDLTYCVTVTSADTESDSWDEGLYSAASFLFE